MDEKLNEIIIESARLFRQYGVRSVSMDDIAKAMGVSKKTLYQFVTNKNDLIEKILDFTYQREVALLEECTKNDVNAIDALLKMSQLISEEVKLFTPTVTFDLKKYYPEIFRRHVEKSQKFAYKAVYRNLQQGISQGLFRKEINAEVVATLYINKIEDVHDENFFKGKEFTFDLIFETMFENHIRGIANEKGIAYFEERKNHYQF
ncbi:MAG: TetR/AcrR family transcriptional regulator [Salinivirgaceae bacterium]